MLPEKCVGSNITCKSCHDHLSIEFTRLYPWSQRSREPLLRSFWSKRHSQTQGGHKTKHRLSKRWDARRDGYLRNGLLPVCKGGITKNRKGCSGEMRLESIEDRTDELRRS